MLNDLAHRTASTPIGIVWIHAPALHQMNQRDTHPPAGHLPFAAAEVCQPVVFLHQATHGVGHREMYRVAPHEMFGLDGGQHGIYPAVRLAALVLDGRHPVFHENPESVGRGLLLFLLRRRNPSQKQSHDHTATDKSQADDPVPTHKQFIDKTYRHVHAAADSRL